MVNLDFDIIDQAPGWLREVSASRNETNASVAPLFGVDVATPRRALGRSEA